MMDTGIHRSRLGLEGSTQEMWRIRGRCTWEESAANFGHRFRRRLWLKDAPEGLESVELVKGLGSAVAILESVVTRRWFLL